jgi:RNA polymerase sigma-70 factor, ECF subfamily
MNANSLYKVQRVLAEILLDDLSDVELMNRLRAGSREAFEVLVRRHQKPLLNFFRRMGAYTDGEDMLQETLLRLFRARAQYAARAKFTTFLYTIARHVWVDRLRKKERSPRIGSESWEGAAADSDHRSRAETRMDLQAALDRLSEKLRPVVVMSLYQGLPYEEIGKVLNIPVGTVKSRMFLALQELKGHLEEYGGPSEK